MSWSDEAPTAEEGFESAQYLVDWALSELADLKALRETYIAGKPLELIEELDRKTQRYDVKLRFKPAPPRYRGLTNNIIKNLRDALDQATNAACTLVNDRPKRNCHFPFAESPDDFDQAVTKNQCKDIPAKLYSLLKGFEPYPASDNYPGGNTFLRLLGRISGPHKHRFTIAPSAGYGGVAVSNFEFFSGSQPLKLMGRPDKSGDIPLVNFSADGKAKLDYKIPYDIVFQDKRMKNIAVDFFLEQCCDTVGGIVKALREHSRAEA